MTRSYSFLLHQAGLFQQPIAARSLMATIALCLTIWVGYLLHSQTLLHWFVIPVLFCGMVIGIDTVDWLRGRLDMFSPIGLLGIIGFHLFFLAPLLHVHWDYWMEVDALPTEWRDWLGGMAILNLIGLLSYRLSRRVTLSKKASRRPRVWHISPQRFFPVLFVFLIGTALLQFWIYQRYGGIQGYMQAYIIDQASSKDAFGNMGVLFMVSESLPILALIGFVVFARRQGWRPGWVMLVAILSLFLAVQLLFGGLRGSRSNTIWAMFWALGIIHFWIRPLSRKHIIIGLFALFGFMTIYSYYKSYGPAAIDVLRDSEQLNQIDRYGGRLMEGVLLADLSRSDVQALVLCRLLSTGSDYEYAWGRTYLGASALLIPRILWPDRPVTKVKEGTDILYGMSAFDPGSFQTSRVFGLAGEAILNFGPAAVPFVFVLYGVFISMITQFIRRLDANDSRILLVPFLINLSFVMLIGDSDNVLFFAFKNGLMPILLLVLGSRSVVASPITQGKQVRTWRSDRILEKMDESRI